MPRDGSKTRNKIMDQSLELIYQNGLSGTTIDLILERTGITKGAFFYHFQSKSDLALNLMQHFKETDMKILATAKAFAMNSSDDPKTQLLAFVQWHIDMFYKLNKADAGCLYASYVYEPDQFGDELKVIVQEAILNWRKELKQMITLAMKKSGKDKIKDLHIESLADMFSVLIEGAFVTAKALDDPKLTARQIEHYKRYVELLLN